MTAGDDDFGSLRLPKPGPPAPRKPSPKSLLKKAKPPAPKAEPAPVSPEQKSPPAPAIPPPPALPAELPKPAPAPAQAAPAPVPAKPPPAPAVKPPPSPDDPSAIWERPAVKVAKLFELSEEAEPLLKEGLNSRSFLTTLIDKGQFLDAVRFLAHALPKRHAVWWGYLCGRQAHGQEPPAKIVAALQAAERWLKDPSEAHREAAGQAGKKAEMSTPAGLVAMAAFWTGGSMVPGIDAPPGETMTASAVATAVHLAALACKASKPPDNFREFLDWGVEVANGKRRWN